MGVTQIAKPAETDFEQSMVTMIDNKKATNLTQSLSYQTMSPNCRQKSDKTSWTFCASILASKIKQNLLMEPDGKLAAEIEQDLRCY